MKTPQTLTELLQKVDWRQVAVGSNGVVYRVDGFSMFDGFRNQLTQAQWLLVTRARLRTAQLFGPGEARWRQHMLNLIHASQTVTEQP